jgi:group I intron endonuclease
LLIKREQYFIDLFKPEYNICKKAGSSLGRKHSEESIAKIKLKLIGRKHSMETIAKLKSYKHSYETIAKIRLNSIGRKHSLESISKMKQNSGFLTTVLNIKDNPKKEYLSRQDVAKDLNLSVRTIFRYLNTTKLLKRTYLIYSTKV